ncbi:MAG: tyrosine--tRNA ligase [Verrucomicrobia bacterium CG_4_10_14_3_um_filter_43_23]|nr:MAG: tyrosine--tRNA ligase [Verrucomicrobia bacterium CG1_02_43_26]PIP59739.1 MAG: tyrosine--tRNA ligase [Verrucomicrobia bacterium CG22_combo_CG10-13_8_21_14_all_43_17]PIX59053.1 MAG: tyrosine--tRNA ligase [Verrucomicrobia bacterium CG_4_10_14_3_um_filter_43_23]PIY62542.1 MAG: tyrosine--tRNA ligase [Verrucomicrobia bacterium CG_4_10_14_0_8_um_filter_43_34]PJA44638.1 MAG: tyrosine--tRNA ligase [Verrucomicrobia bacterium CG_4_9_14_3_um_filter_43_20]
MNALNIIKQGTDTLIGEEDLKSKMASNKPLRVKLGVDPTRPDLTFGHLVVFNKLRQFQELGHQAVLIIGDYTAMIGDPSGRSATRPVLSTEEVQINAKTYLDQVFKVLDKDKTEVRYNSEWFKDMTFADSLNLARKMTVARMLERDDFSKRYQHNTPISIVEFLYPLVQGYDSIMVQADVELGGTDQLFNLLVGRILQKDAGMSEQAVICMPLLVGLDGVQKMSKSYDNYISFNDTAKDMFGKIMSISDDTMWVYYELLLLKTPHEVEQLKDAHPMAMKKALAQALVSRFYSPEQGAHELAQFESVFSKGNLPEDMPEFSFASLSPELTMNLIDLIAATQLFPSKKEIRRLLEQGSVKVDNEKATDPFMPIEVTQDAHIFQIGKRVYFKLLP